MPILGSLAAGSSKGFNPGASIIPVGQALFTTGGTNTWVCPNEVYSISVVCIGGGGGQATTTAPATSNAKAGGGGGLSYKNNIAVVPGTSYTVYVGKAGGWVVYGSAGAGQSSYIVVNSKTYANANGGKVSTGASGNVAAGGTGGISANGAGLADGGANGGSGVTTLVNTVYYGAGGGAGGYAGNGGLGVTSVTTTSAGTGGAGGGGCRARGGGVSPFGQKTSADYARSLFAEGYDGSYATSGGTGGTTSIQYGGGGGYDPTSGSPETAGGGGAVRIIWGPVRYFPSNLTDDQPVVVA